VGRLWIKGQSKVSQQNQGPDPKDPGGLWCPSPGTPWRRPASGSGPRSRLSSLMAAFLLNNPILSMFLCRPVFTAIKSDGFQLCCVILKQHIKSSGFIPATLYFLSVDRLVLLSSPFPRLSVYFSSSCSDSCSLIPSISLQFLRPSYSPSLRLRPSYSPSLSSQTLLLSFPQLSDPHTLLSSALRLSCSPSLSSQTILLSLPQLSDYPSLLPQLSDHPSLLPQLSDHPSPLSSALSPSLSPSLSFLTILFSFP
jgi:hypothetical protein